MPLQRDAKGSQSNRGRGQKALPGALDKSRGREKDSGSQHQDVTGKEEYPVNARGVVVSPENIQRARERRQVKSLKGGWLAAEDSGKCFILTTTSTQGTIAPVLLAVMLYIMQFLETTMNWGLLLSQWYVIR